MEQRPNCLYFSSLISSQQQTLHVNQLNGMEMISSQFLKIPPSFRGSDDKVIWNSAIYDVYIAKKGYYLLLGQLVSRGNHRQNFWKFCRQTKIPFRYILLGWKIINDCLPIGETLNHHHPHVNALCQFGCDQPEFLTQLFFTSSFTRSIWFGELGISSSDFPSSSRRQERMIDFLSTLLNDGESKWANNIITVLKSNMVERKSSGSSKRKIYNRSDHQGIFLDDSIPGSHLVTFNLLLA